MATGYSQLNLNIKTTSDLAGVNQLKQQLNEIRTLAKSVDFTGTLNPTQINQMVTAAKQLDAALDAAFDVNLNTINIQKFNQYLRDSKTSLASIQADLSHAGALGQQAFAQATGQLLRFNTVVKQSNGFLQTMKTSFLNTVRWTVMSSAINEVSSSVRKAYGYVKDLDEALNDIRIVTGKSTEEMQKFAVSANDAAKALAVSTRDYTEGALIYYQQGLDDETVKTLTDVTAKASNVTQQSMETVSEQLTAVWNGYQVANQAAKEGMGIYEEYVDKMAAVGATTASNLEELATAMSKVASAASSMGVGFDELNAQIATIVSVTRQAPESVGTALKTIYARLGDLQVDGVDEFGTTLGDVSGKLQMMGIDVVDMNGNMREMDVVMTEVAEKWNTWTEAQRQAAAVAMAGKRQYNNLIALFDNWDMYSKTLNTAQNAAGTLEEQQSIALDSLDNKLDILTATAEDFYDSLFDEESLKDLVEGLTDVLQVIANVTESIGGLKTILPLVGSLLLKTFGSNIADSLLIFKNNLNAAKLSAMDTKTALNEIQMLYPKVDFVTSTGDNASRLNQGVKDMLSFYQQMLPLKQQMTQQDMQMYNSILDQKVEVTQLNIQLEEEIENYKNLSGLKITSGKGIVFNDKSASGFSGFEELTEGVAIYDRKLQQLNQILDHTSNKLTGATEKDFIRSKQAIQGFFNDLNKSGQFDTRSLEKLQKTINDFIGTKEKLTPKEFEKIQQILNNFPASAKKVLELENSIKKVQEAAKRAGDSLKQNLDFKKVAQGAINGISAIGQLGSALSSIKNLGSIWQNNDLTFADKLLQTMTNLGFAIPMVVNGFTQLKNARIAMFGLTQKELVAQTSLNAMKVFELATEEGLTKAEAAQAAAQVLTAHIENDIARTQAQEIITQELKKVNQDKINTALFEELLLKKQINGENIKGLALETPKGQVMGNLQKMGTTILGFIQGLLGKIIGLLNPWSIAAIIIIAGVLKWYHSYRESLKETAKENQKTSEELKKTTEELKKQKEAVNNVVDGYKNLKKELKDNKSIEELRAKTYDLCVQYEQQDLALKTLMADYEELDKIMEDAQKTSTKDYINAVDEELNQSVSTIETTMFANAKESAGDWVTIGGERVRAFDIQTFNNKDNKELKEVLDKYLKDEDFSIGDGHVSAEALAKAMAEYPEMIDEISKLEGKAAQNIIKAQENAKDQITRHQELNEEYKTSLKEQLIYDNSNDDFIKSLDDYASAVKRMKDKALEEGVFAGEDAEKQAEEWAAIAAGKNLTNKQFVLDYELAFRISEETNESINNAAERFEDLTDDEKKFISLYLETALAEKSFDVFLEKYGLAKQASNLLTGAATIEVFLELDENRVEFIQEEIDSLFALQGFDFEKYSGFIKEDFEDLEFADQITTLIQAYENARLDFIDIQAEAAKEQQALVEKEEKRLQEYKKNYDGSRGVNAVATYIEENNIDIDWIKKQTEGFANPYQSNAKHIYWSELGNLVKAYYGGDEAYQDLIQGANEEEINTIQEEFIDAINNMFDGDGNFKEYVISESKYKEQVEKLEDAVLEAANAQNKLTNKTWEHDKVTKAAVSAEDAYSKSLDNLQSTYTDLTDIVSEYNETGTLSVDTMQKILAMSPEQLQYLKFENGQMSLNIEMMKESVITKLQNQKASLELQLREGLLAIAEGKATEAGIQLAKTNAALAMSTAEVGSEAYRSAEAMAIYAEELTNGVVTAEQIMANSEMNEYAEYIRKQLLAVDESIDNINKNGLSISLGDSKSKKDIEDIYDRYWTLNKELEKLAETLEDLDEIQSHLHGKTLIESLEKENKLLKEQEETYNRLYEAQKIEATELRGKLSQYGVKFQDGNVINYDAAVKGLNEAQYEKFQELFERYDELFYSEMVDTLNKIEEINYERLANELEAFEVQLELNLETTEAERALDEFTKELNKDFKSVYENFDQELKHIVDSYNTYIRKNGTIDSIISAIQTVQKEIDALRDNDDTTDSTMFATVGDAQEKLKELQEQLQDATLESRDLMEEYWDTYLDSIDQAAEKFEELSEEFDAINDELDYQRELIELIYGPEAYGMQKQIFDAQINNSLAQVDSARQQVDLWQSYYDQAEEGTEEQLKYAELLKEAQAELNDLTLEHIQLLKDDYANTMNDILTKLEKDITGGLGLDDMREEWEEAVKESEKYYDNIERIFELETLENKFQNAIDNTASPKYQQAIKDLMEDQLATLKDKEQLTEYDVQLAEKRLGILQAEAALEDAQNAKNAMKLVRGASGNWEYQYVADTSDIENKQQALRESYQELYEFAKDAQLDSIEALMEAKDDYITKLHEIKDDETLSEEEKLIKIAEINDKYWNEEEGIITKLQQDYYNKTQTLSTASAESLLGLYKADESAYYDMTEYEKGLVDEFKHHAETSYTDMYLAIQEEYKQDQEKFDSYVDSNLLHWQTAASDMAAAWNGDEDSIRTNVNEAYESISDATTEYSLELEKLEATSGDSFGEEGIAGDINTAIDYTNILKTKTEELVTLANQKLPEYKTQIENIGIAWSDVADKIDNASEQLKYYLELSEIEVPEPTTSGDGSGGVGSGNNTAPGGPSGSGGAPNKNPNNSKEYPSKLSFHSMGANGSYYTGSGHVSKEELEKILNNGRDKKTGNYMYGESTFLLDHEVKALANQYDLKYTERPKTDNTATKTNNIEPGDIVDSKERLNGDGDGKVKYWLQGATSDGLGMISKTGQSVSVNSFNGKNKVLKKYPWKGENYYQLNIDEMGRWFKESQLVKLDTGGYTGDWSSGEGRMAMLHSKELVLNKVDTENILNAVSAVRDMTGITSSVGSAIMQNIKAMIMEVLGISAGTGRATRNTNNETSNVFHITAEFPNANSVETIQEAILSLPNIASQYVAENRR